MDRFLVALSKPPADGVDKGDIIATSPTVLKIRKIRTGDSV